MRTAKKSQALDVLFRVVILVTAAASLAGCGGGSGSATPTPHQSASVTYPSPSLTFVAGTAITPVTPTASEGLSEFTVEPGLPDGLSLDASNGTISGTPKSVTAAATYTVTASGGGATASASLSITVNPAAPTSLTYGAAAFTFTTHITARTLRPAQQGGAASSWSISPALPTGLTFDTTDGSISGTPTSTSPATSYVVTAHNATGQATDPLRIEVDSGVLLDVGHDTVISVLRMSGTSVLSMDQSGHWNLWDYTSAAEIARGDLYCAPTCYQLPNPSHLADMAGGTVVLATQNGFEFLSATSGQVISNVTASVSWWTLASDGSYLAAGSSTGLFAWSPSGDSLASLPGDYSKAIAFTAPGQIQVAAGPAGQNVIQTVSVPGGTSTTGPAFNGTFSSWFLDGSRFMTVAGTTVQVYSAAGAQQATMVFSTTDPFVGQGNWIWTNVPTPGPGLEVFPVASSTAPVAALTVAGTSSATPSGTTLAANTASGLEVIDLSGSAPSETQYANYSQSAYAAVSTSQWMLAENSVLIDGASLGGTPRDFDYGAVSSIAASSGAIAVATASGRIVYFDTSTLTQEGVIPLSASQILLSSDGSVLAAVEDDGSIAIYSLPSAGLLYTWSYPSSGGVSAQDVGLSGSGTVLTQALYSSSPITLEASPATGGSPIFSTTVSQSRTPPFSPEIFASPNGTSLATTSGAIASGATPGTDLWSNATLTAAVTGYPIGWLDDGHLLVNTYSFSQMASVVYAGCNVYSPSGQSTGPCALPQVFAFQTVTSDTIYAANLGEILSVSTGIVAWTSGDTTPTLDTIYAVPQSQGLALGGIAGSHAIFLSGAYVLAQGY